MLNPELLRRKAAEAAERLERERRLEEERLLREAEMQRLEEERRKAQEAERARLQKLARAAMSRAWRGLVKASAQGARAASLPVEEEIASTLVAEMEQHGFTCRIKRMSKWHEQASERLSTLLLKLPSGEEASPLRDALAQTLKGRGLKSAVVLDFLRTLRTDAREKLGDSVALYLNTVVLPHFESTAADTLITHVRVDWQPVELDSTHLSNVVQVPFWMASTSGSGLMERIGHSLASDAERGKTVTSFELSPLPKVVERWGSNSMTKFVYEGQPIGVTPFSPSAMADVLVALGFKARADETRSPVRLEVSWA